jgi:hypothetical protein
VLGRITHLLLESTRANVPYARLDPKCRGCIQISAELPLIRATGRRTELTEVQVPPIVTGANLNRISTLRSIHQLPDTTEPMLELFSLISRVRSF